MTQVKTSKGCANCIHIEVCPKKEEFETAMEMIADMDTTDWFYIDVKCHKWFENPNVLRF